MLPALDVPLRRADGATLRRDRVRDAPTSRSTTPLDLPPALGHCATGCEPSSTAARVAAGCSCPPGFNPRTLALGAQWRQRYGRTMRAIVQAALNMFHDDGFSYTLAPAPLGRDAVDDFLFDTREGFCEHYASAFTVLMRAAGIPARVVTGYQGGYWNKLGDYLLVRQSDAHAWSEVWLAGRGWVRVDPTAAVRPERVNLGAAAAAGDQLRLVPGCDWLQGLRNRWDIVNRWWDQGRYRLRCVAPARPADAVRHSRRRTPTMLALLLAHRQRAVHRASGLAWAIARRRTRDPLLGGAARGWNASWPRRGITRRPSEGPQHYLQPRRPRPARATRRTDALDGAAILQLRYAHDEPAPESLRAVPPRRAGFSGRPRGQMSCDAMASRPSPLMENTHVPVPPAHPRRRACPAGRLRHGPATPGRQLRQRHPRPARSKAAPAARRCAGVAKSSRPNPARSKPVSTCWPARWTARRARSRHVGRQARVASSPAATASTIRKSSPADAS